MNKPLGELKELAAQFPKARLQFEEDVQFAAHEAIEIAKRISSAIGDVSIFEAKQAVLEKFTKELFNE